MVFLGISSLAFKETECESHTETVYPIRIQTEITSCPPACLQDTIETIDPHNLHLIDLKSNPYEQSQTSSHPQSILHSSQVLKPFILPPFNSTACPSNQQKEGFKKYVPKISSEISQTSNPKHAIGTLDCSNYKKQRK